MRKVREALDEVVSAEDTDMLEPRIPFEVLMDQWLEREDGRDLLIAVQPVQAESPA